MAEIYLTDYIGKATISLVLDDATGKLVRIEVNNAESRKLKATLINYPTAPRSLRGNGVQEQRQPTTFLLR